jgi:hypothetical protein
MPKRVVSKAKPGLPAKPFERTRLGDKIAARREPPKDLRFWKVPEAEKNAHEAVWAMAQRINKLTRRRRQDDIYFAALYDDSELGAMLQGSHAIGEFTPQTLATNIVKPQVNTYVAKITKNRPMPMGLTTGGNYGEQRRAKALSKFGEGQLDAVKFWDTRMLRHRDAAVWGSGLALNYRIGREMRHDRIFRMDVSVDPREALYGCPRTIYLTRPIDRLVMLEQYPEHEQAILDAASHDPDSDTWTLSYEETSDQVLVRDAWHLRSSCSATDGYWARTISNATLEMRGYDRDYFPISKLDFDAPMFGWWGEGMVKDLVGLQYEVNAIGLKLQERHYLMGTYVTREANSSFDVEQLDNGTLTELVYTGQKPDFLSPPATGPDLLSYFQMLRSDMAAQITRQGSLSTRGEIPQGLLGSGKAQRTYKSIEDEGFIPQGRRDEQDVIDTMWQQFDLAEEIYEESKGKEGKEAEPYTVKVDMREHGRSTVEDLDFSKVRLDRDKFKLRVFSTSFLASTPEDRYAQVQEMKADGFLSEDEALSLMDFPDVERVLSLRTAARRNIERIMEKMLDPQNDGYEILKAYPPIPQMNPDLCVVLGLQSFLTAKLDGAPQKNLEAALEWVELAREMKNTGEGAEPNATQPGELPPNEEDMALMDPGMDPAMDPMMTGGAPPETFVPPDEAPLPANAVAPEVMAPIPGM